MANNRLGWIAAIVLVAGLVLMTLMIVVESEPGALPLLLVLLGACGLILNWRKRRSGQ